MIEGERGESFKFLSYSVALTPLYFQFIRLDRRSKTGIGLDTLLRHEPSREAGGNLLTLLGEKERVWSHMRTTSYSGGILLQLSLRFRRTGLSTRVQSLPLAGWVRAPRQRHAFKEGTEDTRGADESWSHGDQVARPRRRVELEPTSERSSHVSSKQDTCRKLT